jgi:hypothetical protein
MAFVGFIQAKCDRVPANHIGLSWHLWVKHWKSRTTQDWFKLQASVGWLLEIEIDPNSSQGCS